MATLADELGMDPVFADLGLDDRRSDSGDRGSLTFEQDELLRDDTEDFDSVSSSSFASPQASRQRRTNTSARRGRALSHKRISSDDDYDEEHRTHVAAGGGFSLADELGNGNIAVGDNEYGAGGAQVSGTTLADDVEGSGGLILEEKHPRGDAPINPNPSLLYNAVDDEARARRDQEHYIVSSEILNDSVRQSDAFLIKLRKVTDSGLTGGALPSLASSNSVTMVSGGVPSVSSSDDTAGIESAAAALVRQLRKHTQTREGQVRELQECDRILRRAFEEGGEYLMAVAEIQGAAQEESGNEDIALAVLPEERDPLGYAVAAREMMASRRIIRNNSIDDSALAPHDIDDSTMTADVRSPSEDLMTSLADDSMETDNMLAKPSAFQDLTRLQQSTHQLIGSLGIIHEHSQIAGASMGDASRIIRNVRNVLSNWQIEVQSMEQSQAWIASREAEQDNYLVTNAPVNRSKDVRQWSQDQLGHFNQILEDAHVKARELLKPVRDPVLDRLAATRA